jgi:hypothetical protein
MCNVIEKKNGKSDKMKMAD